MGFLLLFCLFDSYFSFFALHDRQRATIPVLSAAALITIAPIEIAFFIIFSPFEFSSSVSTDYPISIIYRKAQF